MDAGIMDEIRNNEKADKDRFYILLEFLFKKYGVEGETKEITTNYKVWVASILFSHSQLQECHRPWH
jgi:hypothetical protein